MSPKPQSIPTPRRGAAAVEFAVCLPVVILLVFGGIQASNMIFLRQALNVAAYEGICEATTRSATNHSVSNRVREVLESRRVRGYELQLPNRSIEETKRGQKITIVVTASVEENTSLARRFVRNTTLRARASMVKQ